MKFSYTYKKSNMTFTVPSAYTAKPLVFAARRKLEPTAEERRAMRAEIDLCEEWARDEEDTVTRKFRLAYTEKLRTAFRMILKGYRHYRCSEVTTWRKATRLNEKGENDYRIVCQDRFEHYEWRKVAK